MSGFLKAQYRAWPTYFIIILVTLWALPCSWFFSARIDIPDFKASDPLPTVIYHPHVKWFDRRMKWAVEFNRIDGEMHEEACTGRGEDEYQAISIFAKPKPFPMTLDYYAGSTPEKCKFKPGVWKVVTCWEFKLLRFLQKRYCLADEDAETVFRVLPS